jgi:hypothetical protein
MWIRHSTVGAYRETYEENSGSSPPELEVNSLFALWSSFSIMDGGGKRKRGYGMTRAQVLYLRKT